jgi:hypothetical protein
MARSTITIPFDEKAKKTQPGAADKKIWYGVASQAEFLSRVEAAAVMDCRRKLGGRLDFQNTKSRASHG